MYRFARKTLFFLFLVPWIAACGDDAHGPADPAAPTELTVTPAAGAVGTPVALEGIDLSAVDPTEVEVRFGDDLAVARVQPASGAVIAGVPIPLAEDGTVARPTGEAIGVTVSVDGRIVASREAAFTIEAFDPAPGATEDVVESFASIVDDVETVALALAPDPSLEYGYAMALLGAARELLAGEGEGSLGPQLVALANDDPEALALLDGILAGSGAMQRVKDVATQLEAISAVAERISLPRRTTELTDSELAMRMQLYVMVRDVGQQVIGQTTSTWGTWMGTVVGGIAFVGVGGTVAAPGVALAGTIGTVLGLVNTAVDKIALSYLPAQIDSFELIADPLVVAPGEVAQTEIWIQASNQPATITTLDLVDLVLNGLGVLPGSLPSGHPRRVALIQTIDYFLGIFRGLLSNYASQVPTSDLAFDVASIPSMTWRARVTDTRYVTPLSQTPEVIDATGAGILAWRAATDGEGEGRIFARINNGPEVTSLVQIPGYEYNAGAFGDDVLATETLSVYVSPPVFALASMDPRITAGGTNGLEVRVGTVGATGDTTWVESALVECIATGGTVAPATGTTGPDGRFDTFVTLDPGSDRVTVDVTATGDFDQQATRSVEASSADERLVLAIRSMETSLEPGVPDAITIQGHYEDHDGNFVRYAGNDVTLSLSADGGTVSPTTQFFDEGSASATVTLESPARELVITATAIDGQGRTESASATSLSLEEAPVLITYNFLRVWQGISERPNYYWDSHGGDFEGPPGDRGIPLDFERNIQNTVGAFDAACSLRTRVEPTRGEDGLIDGVTMAGRIWTRASSSDDYGYVSGQIQSHVDITVNEGSWRIGIQGQIVGGPQVYEGGTPETYANFRISDTEYEDVAFVRVDDGTATPVDETMVVGPGVYRLWANVGTRLTLSGSSTPNQAVVDAEYSIEVTIEPN